MMKKEGVTFGPCSIPSYSAIIIIAKKYTSVKSISSTRLHIETHFLAKIFSKMNLEKTRLAQILDFEIWKLKDTTTN